ncbi:MAG TPA: UTP--glucose-1-phosphate uridylyltransferase [Alphaproteobacteria bacterium]|jgi:UTP--glucose-1-phosphate uridylyltransferase|nr:UTP--glucose-1-phosphate uridylyltransferase [Alphaproteobacteria bacterium]HIK87421.1 UTP--glucose-1-phosphate uridylyltransferase [Alphaproteobacteria bacterium]
MNSSNEIKTVVFPVAGIGSRFLPVTKMVPKELLPILNRPLIEYAINEAKEAGIEKFIFVISPEKKSIINYFKKDEKLESILRKKNPALLEQVANNLILDDSLIEVIQEEPLGLGHAIWCARDFIDGPFAVILPDDLIISKVSCIKQMIDAYEEHKSNVIAVQEVDTIDISKYGVINYSKNSKNFYFIEDMVEKPSIEEAPSNLAIIGRYILMPNIMNALSTKKVGYGGEIQLTDAIKSTINNDGVVGYKFEGNRYDCGNIVGALEAQLSVAINNSKYRDQVIKIINKSLK